MIIVINYIGIFPSNLLNNLFLFYVVDPASDIHGQCVLKESRQHSEHWGLLENLNGKIAKDIFSDQSSQSLSSPSTTTTTTTTHQHHYHRHFPPSLYSSSAPFLSMPWCIFSCFFFHQFEPRLSARPDTRKIRTNLNVLWTWYRNCPENLPKTQGRSSYSLGPTAHRRQDSLGPTDVQTNPGTNGAVPKVSRHTPDIRGEENYQKLQQDGKGFVGVWGAVPSGVDQTGMGSLRSRRVVGEESDK